MAETFIKSQNVTTLELIKQLKNRSQSRHVDSIKKRHKVYLARGHDFVSVPLGLLIGHLPFRRTRKSCNLSSLPSQALWYKRYCEYRCKHNGVTDSSVWCRGCLLPMSDDGDDSNTPHVHVADEREEVRTERAMVGVSDHGKVLRSGKGDAGIRSEFDQGDGGMEQGGEDDGESTGFEYSGDASEDLQLRAPKRRQVRAGDEVGVLGRDDQESHDPVRDRSPSRMREVEIVGNDEREGYFDNAPAGFSYVELPEPKRRRRMEPPTESIKAIHKRTREYVHLADVEAFLGKPGLTSPSFLLRRELSGRVPGICHPGEHSKKLSKVDSDVPSSSEQAAGVRGDEGNPNAVSGPSDADGSGEGVRRGEYIPGDDMLALQLIRLIRRKHRPSIRYGLPLDFERGDLFIPLYCHWKGVPYPSYPFPSFRYFSRSRKEEVLRSEDCRAVGLHQQSISQFLGRTQLHSETV